MAAAYRPELATPVVVVDDISNVSAETEESGVTLDDILDELRHLRLALTLSGVAADLGDLQILADES